MSELQCPARVILCRHADAAYERPAILADEGGYLTEKGADQSRMLARELRDERVAVVVSSPLRSARETARIVSDWLAVPLRVLDGLREFSIGDLHGRAVGRDVAEVFERWMAGDLTASCPGGETGAAVVRRMRETLDDLADEHPGETVLAVSHGGAMALAGYYIASGRDGIATRGPLLPTCALVPFVGDRDGWRMDGPWPGVGRTASA